LEEIQRLITEIVAPDGWRDAGGTIGSFREFNGRLVIVATPDMHRQIAELLQNMLGQVGVKLTINASGTTGRGSGVTGSAKLATGQYEVVFNRDVTGCSYQATMSITQGEAVVQPRTSVPNGVFVGTSTSAGAAADRAFHLAVFC